LENKTKAKFNTDLTTCAIYMYVVFYTDAKMKKRAQFFFPNIQTLLRIQIQVCNVYLCSRINILTFAAHRRPKYWRHVGFTTVLRIRTSD
jgi:hypothetical protein